MEWKKSDTRVHVVWFHSYEVQEQAKSSLADIVKIGLPLMEHWKGHRECDNGAFYLDWGVGYTDTHLCQNSPIVCLTSVYFTVCNHSSTRESKRKRQRPTYSACCINSKELGCLVKNSGFKDCFLPSLNFWQKHIWKNGEIRNLPTPSKIWQKCNARVLATSLLF